MNAIVHANGCDHNSVWKGLAAGLIGGLVASWTMNRFQNVWSKVAKGIETWPANQFQNVPREYTVGGRETLGAQDPVVVLKTEVQDDTTVRAASAVSEGIFDH